MSISIPSRRDLDAVLRNDLTAFIHKSYRTLAPASKYHDNWHIWAMAWHLQQCASGKIKRLLITLPPRNLKSISAVAFAAWVLGRDPSKRIICASYSADLASKHAHDCRAVMESAWYRHIFPRTRIDKNTEMDFVTSLKGYRYSTSVGGTLTGRGGDMLIIDDPLKSEDALSETRRSAVNDWYDGTLYSRLDDKREGVIILIMQRHHLDDLAGHVLRQEEWTQLDLPAIAELDERIPIGPRENYFRKVGELLHDAREGKGELDQMKVTLGSFRFSAQYQQRPVPEEGEIIKWNWFRVYDAPLQRQNGEIIQSWDTAYKAQELSDYSVCTTWLVRGNEYNLIDVLREKLNYPDLKKTVLEHARKHVANSVIIENKGSGMSLIDDLRQGGSFGDIMPIPFDPEGDKVTRMSTESAQIEAGHVFLPRNAEWLGDFQAELLQFPHGRHDDQVDSMSQFLAWIRKRSTESFRYEFIDPRPTPEELFCQWTPASGSPIAAPASKPKVIISVLERVGLDTYRTANMSEADYAAQIAAAAETKK